MMEGWEVASWPEAELGQAVLELCAAARLEPRGSAGQRSCPTHLEEGDVDVWIRDAAAQLGVRAQTLECGYAELQAVLGRMAPALLCIAGQRQRRYFAVLRSSERELSVLTPALAIAAIRTRELSAHLSSELEREPRRKIDAWLEQARFRPRHARRATRALLGFVLSEQRVGGIWLFSTDPGSSFAAQLRQRHVGSRLLAASALLLCQIVATWSGWALLGRGALRGSIEPGWVGAWVLACVSGVFLQLTAGWLGGRALADLALLLKQRLLSGALRLDADRIRERGPGRLLALVQESELVESAGLNGGFSVCLALVQLASAAFVLALGAGGLLHVLLLLAWCSLLATLGRRAWRLRSARAQARFALSNSFVENLAGNRSRIAQQPREQWHLLEDRQLRDYVQASRQLEAVEVQLTVLPARGWLILGFLGLAPALLREQAGAPELAIALGGILQAYTSFGVLARGMVRLSSAAIAWQHVIELFAAARNLPLPGSPALAGVAPASASQNAPVASTLLELRGLTFRHRALGKLLLQDCDLVLRRGDRLLLEGPSGGGKSTLASLLVGLRAPESGHVLFGGLDRQSLGAAAWLRCVASAPQFHDNYLLSASLAFNLLMGRAWPASESDLEAARAVCRDLGLEALLRKMPSGLHQIIGETGWQLSHGERSRVFLARALLQGAQLVVLDESFGALDPDTLKVCMNTVLARAPSLIVIAHP